MTFPRRSSARAWAAAVAVAGGSLGFACGSSEPAPSEPACLAKAGPLDCTALYGLDAAGNIAPTFHDVWTHTLQPKCARPGCHVQPDPKNGLALDDEGTAYTDLLAKSPVTGEPRVTPGDLRCGRFIVRLETTGESWSMPPGDHLDDQTLCDIRHWIANGAPR